MFIVQCCVCGKVRYETHWTYISKKKIESYTVSHSYCPECANAFRKQISEFHNHENKPKNSYLPKEKH